MKVIDKAATRWEKIAIRLNLDRHQIAEIKRDHHFSTDACREVFCMWLDGRGGLRRPITWITLIRVLEEAGINEIARKLRAVIGKVNNS